MTREREPDTQRHRRPEDIPGPPPGRAPDDRVTAWCLAALLAVGAGLGSLNLFIDGVLRDGPTRWVYLATMLVLALLGAALAVRRRVDAATTAGLVVLGDVVYVVVARSVTDPMLYATPLMLLFCCAAAAWFLGPRMLVIHLVLVVVACTAALAGNYPDTAGLVVQVTVNSVVLDLVTVVVFTLRRRVERLLTHTRALSSTDPLTGLANRRCLVEQAPRIWRQARREGQRVVALVLDLDHFKRLNDAFGHAAGDDVLRAVADALTRTVRPTDVLARTGGEELVVIGLAGDPAEARQLAERLRTAVATSTAGRDREVTVSIGVAVTRPGDTEDPTEALWRLVDRADAAMYRAKESGRDQVVLAGTQLVPLPRHPEPGRPSSPEPDPASGGMA
ncbi:GGDEF domain-containing protein [Modestobacter roseus]|uniref:GGDEF domain-containing protein n=1 Tax=Modestobacter roseus TaxID=1181884 RepID=UPI001296B439|nr:GGDEF domain-containing protein [Modestobacter roseus]MQA32476.1 diguanylate cyclase [Modestobacter roseus]